MILLPSVDFLFEIGMIWRRWGVRDGGLGRLSPSLRGPLTRRV